jgi:hypothetical protein
MPSRRSLSFEEALSFVEREGIVLESAHGRVATFADFVAGERVSGWWGHSKGRLIFALTRALRDSPDVLTYRWESHLRSPSPLARIGKVIR